VRELACGAGAALVSVEYDRSPEARYPVAIEQGYATARWIVRAGAAHGLDPERMAIAGDSVGGGMTAAITLMAQERGDVRFVHQSMYYPVTDAAMDTGSYAQFAEGYFLTAKAMAWFWDCYCPYLERRSEAFASPLRASDEQLAGLPPALLIVDEADVLRDEGEAYASRLQDAGVAIITVRYDGITHDFMMLNPLSETHATRAAAAQAIATCVRSCTPPDCRMRSSRPGDAGPCSRRPRPLDRRSSRRRGTGRVARRSLPPRGSRGLR
jgi:acetyl esterase